jgi:hypothetical protein
VGGSWDIDVRLGWVAGVDPPYEKTGRLCSFNIWRLDWVWLTDVADALSRLADLTDWHLSRLADFGHIGVWQAYPPNPQHNNFWG